MRLDKYLNDVFNTGRKEIHRIIRTGTVSVNGVIQTSPDYKIKEAQDSVSVNGEPVIYRKYVYYMMNKPSGYITAMEDRRQPTIADIIPDEILKQQIFPVGRLDKDTTGLIFLTNDGQFAHKMISPKSDVEKVYYVKYTGQLIREAPVLFEQGIILEDGTQCRPAKLVLNGEQQCIITVTEGKYHQVKRMVSAVGGEVTALHREEIGGILLDPSLEEGKTRLLSDNELCILMTLF